MPERQLEEDLWQNSTWENCCEFCKEPSAEGVCQKCHNNITQFEIEMILWSITKDLSRLRSLLPKENQTAHRFLNKMTEQHLTLVNCLNEQLAR